MWGLIGIAVLGSVVTHAEEAARVAFRYQVRDAGDNRLTAECPTEEEIMRSVEARLGYAPWYAGAGRVVDAVFFKEGEETVARIYLWHADGRLIGSREVRSRQGCKETADSAALAISIAVAPALALTEQPSTSQVEPASARKPADCPTVVPPPPLPRRHVKGILFLGGLGTWGTGPSITGGMDVGVELRVGIASVVAAFRYDFPSELEVNPGRIRSRQMLGQLWGCLNHTFVYGCVGLSAGARQAWAEDLEEARDGVSAALWGAIRFGVNIPLVSRLSLRLYADFTAAIVRQRLLESGTDALFWETPSAGAVWGAALAITFFDGNRTVEPIKQ